MKTLTATFVLLLVTLSAAFAADVDGKWKSERTMERNGQSMTITMVFDLKADGSTLTGKVVVTTPRGDRESKVSDGKIDGNKFSFTTVSEGPMGTMTTKYEGTVEGDTLKGTSAREGGNRTMPFEAKKQ
jgi:hypothetical protein